MALNAQNIDAMVVDLRSNGGGSLDESINIAGLFIDKGPVVQIKRLVRVEINIDEATDKIESGEIKDGKTIMLLQYIKLHHIL